MTTPTRCWLQHKTKTDGCTVADVIAPWLSGAPPLLAWAEPDPLQVVTHNKTGRRDDFRPLVQGTPSWPNDLPLIEARLFWPTAALHVVAHEAGGCRWMRIEEFNAPTEATDTVEVMRTPLPVYTISDQERFGLPDSVAIEHLQAIEYRQRGRLISWRLTIGTEE